MAADNAVSKILSVALDSSKAVDALGFKYIKFVSLHQHVEIIYASGEKQKTYTYIYINIYIKIYMIWCRNRQVLPVKIDVIVTSFLMYWDTKHYFDFFFCEQFNIK